MTDGKLNQTAQRQQEDRRKRLAEALRANMALRKNRVRSATAADQQPMSDDAAPSEDQGN